MGVFPHLKRLIKSIKNILLQLSCKDGCEHGYAIVIADIR